MPRMDLPSAHYAPCEICGEKSHDHDKRRVYDDDGPAGSYHVEYWCPGTKPGEAA